MGTGRGRCLPLHRAVIRCFMPPRTVWRFAVVGVLYGFKEHHLLSLFCLLSTSLCFRVHRVGDLDMIGVVRKSGEDVQSDA